MIYVFDFRKIKKIVFAVIIIVLLGACAYTAFSWYYPLKYLGIIQKYCAQYDLNPALVCGVIHAESKFDDSAVSQKGASGLMQVVRNTADWAASEIGINKYDYKQILDPEINIQIGCWVLNRMERQFGDLQTALAAYNAGSGNVSKWLDNKKYSKDGETLDTIPFKETENYVKRVEFNTKIYEFILKIYGGTYEDKK